MLRGGAPCLLPASKPQRLRAPAPARTPSRRRSGRLAGRLRFPRRRGGTQRAASPGWVAPGAAAAREGGGAGGRHRRCSSGSGGGGGGARVARAAPWWHLNARLAAAAVVVVHRSGSQRRQQPNHAPLYRTFHSRCCRSTQMSSRCARLALPPSDACANSGARSTDAHSASLPTPLDCSWRCTREQGRWGDRHSNVRGAVSGRAGVGGRREAWRAVRPAHSGTLAAWARSQPGDESRASGPAGLPVCQAGAGSLLHAPS